MDIEISNANGELTVKVTGCLDTSATPKFKAAVDGIAAEVKAVIFDFTNLEFIASSALRVMVALGKRLHADDGNIAIVGANEVVRDVFEITGLAEVFAIR